jgi:hypothetical protein
MEQFEFDFSIHSLLILSFMQTEIIKAFAIPVVFQIVHLTLSTFVPEIAIT